MNILLINHYAGSKNMGMEFRPYYFAREWVKKGHKVDIISADYSHLRRINPQVDKDFQKEVIDGINYYWIKTNIYEGNGIDRAKTMAKFIFKLWKNAKKIVRELEPDVVIGSSTYPLDTFVCQKIRKVSKKNIPYIHEAHDMWPATLVELGGMSTKHPFVKAMALGEKSVCKNADYIVSLLEYTEEHFQSLGLDKNKFMCIPLGVEIDDWQFKDLNKKHLDEISAEIKKGNFIVGYFGGHAMSNALDILIDVAIKMREHNDIKFVLVGNGVEKNRLIKRAEDENLDNILFLDPVSKEEIPSLLNLFDAIYMGTYDNSLYRFGMCLNKMADTMMSGKPSVCSITSPPTWVEQAKSGIIVKSEDIIGIEKAILDIKNMSIHEREGMGKLGIEYVEKNLNIHILANNFENLMKRLIEEKSKKEY